MTDFTSSGRETDAYQRLRGRARAWLRRRPAGQSRFAEYLLFAPDLFHLMTKLALDADVPASERVKLAGAVAYFVSPLDLISEAVLGPLAFSGDALLVAYVVNSVIESAGPGVVRRHWAGDEEVLQVVQRLLAGAESWLTPPQWRRIKRILGRG